MQSSPRTSRLPIWAGAIVGTLIGLADGASLIVGLLLGLVSGYALYACKLARVENKQLLQRLGDLLERVSLLEYAVKRLRSAAPMLPEPALEVEVAQAPAELQAPITARPDLATPSAVPASTYVAPILAAAVPAPARPRVMPPPKVAAPSVAEKVMAATRAWIFGGNTVARVGLLVLFVGVAFLLRYVAERTQIPIELRLVGVALGGLALLVIGWRLRHKRLGYAITLQGGAIGILYLTVFAAMRLYDVLPAVPAFALLALLAVFSGVLAVAQNARALAALGATGGFLAPILVSAGSGRIEILLSFYLLLNLGVCLASRGSARGAN
ncbi:MAG: DUF2339 domain-containing protein [Burkholderiaceae bacterium]|nr:DUF2339 domain-containing protein [Burkholderiaceae bacterium]